jgi:hypothetical protein
MGWCEVGWGSSYRRWLGWRVFLPCADIVPWVVEGCCEGRRVISKTEFRLAGLGSDRVFGMLALREGLIKGNSTSDVCETVHVSELPFGLI